MGYETNPNARKADFESVAFRTFDFEKIVNNDSQDPDENFATLLILKIHNILLLKSPHVT